MIMIKGKRQRILGTTRQRDPRRGIKTVTVNLDRVLPGIYLIHVSQGVERQVGYDKGPKVGQIWFLKPISASLLLISTFNYLCPYKTFPTCKWGIVFSQATLPSPLKGFVPSPKLPKSCFVISKMIANKYAKTVHVKEHLKSLASFFTQDIDLFFLSVLEGVSYGLNCALSKFMC